MRSLIFAILLVTTITFPYQDIQGQNYAKDTSYTVAGSYKKYIKEFPFIKLVKPVPNEDIEEIQDLTYKSLDKRALHLDVISNKKVTENAPAVIMIHGGGWISGDKSHMMPMAFQLAKNGYVAVPVEYRLSPEAKYPAAINDIRDAVIWIKEHAEEYKIDTSKIALLGSSAGGQLASLVGMASNSIYSNKSGSKVHPSSAVQAIINMDGVLAFHHPVSKEGRVAGLWLGGNYEEAKENWEEASAINHVDKMDPPTLFIHSQYPRFHAGRDEVVNMLSKYGIYSEVQGFENCPHTFWLFDPWFQPTINYTLDFLNRVF